MWIVKDWFVGELLDVRDFVKFDCIKTGTKFDRLHDCLTDDVLKWILFMNVYDLKEKGVPVDFLCCTG